MGGPDRQNNQRGGGQQRRNQPYQNRGPQQQNRGPQQQNRVPMRNTEDNSAVDKKPCRVLFVRNVEYSTTEADIRDLFEPFGEVKLVFDLIAKRGLVFITYVC
jgi:RNA recognition motif-containing protein